MQSIMLRISFLGSSNRRLLKKSHYVTFSTLTRQNPEFNYSNRRREDEGRSVRVSVWWDFENCNLPANANVYRVAQFITNAVRANGIKGPIQVTAFGDVLQISRTNQEALSATGINLCHVPTGGKNSADRSLLVDLMYWVSQNPPPAHIFLISGDRDFAGILHKLRMNNYNILLASTESAPNVLCSAATIMWQWSGLVKGENLTGRLFNQPPDGPYNSWYGHYSIPLENPFEVMEQSSCIPAEESAESDKVQSIPKPVVKFVRQILNSNPEGITISQLGELIKGNEEIDKDLYGYKKISRFLSAMPHIVKLHPSSKQCIVKAVWTKSPDKLVPTTYRGSSETRISPQPNGEINSGDDMKKSIVSQCPEPIMEAQLNPKESQKGERRLESSSTYSPGVKVKAYQKSLEDPNGEQLESSIAQSNVQEIQEQDKTMQLQEKPKNVLATSTVSESKYTCGEDENQVSPDKVSAAETGIFRKIWMKWFVSGDKTSEEENCKKCEVKSEKDDVEEKAALSCESSEFVSPALFSPSSHEALLYGKIPRVGGGVTDISSQSSSSPSRMTSWLKFWSSSECDDKIEEGSEAIDQVKVHSKKLELFSKRSFWKEMESFMATSQGAAVFTQSSTREHLVQNLQKQGPPVLKSLPEGDVLSLIEILITDKKWMEEWSSQAFPFKITQPAGKDPVNSRPKGPNGLTHIFADRQPNLQELGERQHQNPSCTGVQQNVVHRGSSNKPRKEMMADFQKLVVHIVKEYPEGYNMASFRKLFIEKHGYALDLQKLGFAKLVNLFQTMPEVRIESSFIFPAGAFEGLKSDLPIQESKIGPVSNPSTESSISSPKDDDTDSWLDELGPVDVSVPVKQETNVSLSRSEKGKTVEKLPDFEPLNEDVFSDSEGYTSSEEISSRPETRPETKRKSKMGQDKSSLLQILDSWYTDDKKKPRGTTNSIDDTTGTGSLPSRTKGESLDLKRHKPLKTYSFVVEQPVDGDKLVDDILDRLKSSSDGPSSGSKMLG